MSKIPFTDEQIKRLHNNPHTYNVTPNTLYLTRKFKELFYKEYQNGKLPKKETHLTEFSPKAAIKQLQHEVEYLRQEVEFLKKSTRQ